MTASNQNMYKDTCAYLNSETDINPFEPFINTHPIYGLFVKMREITDSSAEKAHDINVTYASIEKYMDLYLSDNLDHDSVQYLKQTILGSEKVYTKLMRKIDKHVNTILEKPHSSTFFYQTDSELSGQLVKNDNRLNNNTPRKKGILRGNNAIVSGLLASAAVLLILFIIPLELQQDLNELYNFDSKSALNYQTESLRGAEEFEDIKDPDYKLFRQQFRQGMASYMAQEYEIALKEWKIIEDKLPGLRKHDGFAEKEKQLKLYKAISHLSIALSDNKQSADQDKTESLSNALTIFESMQIDSDTSKYYFALALAVNKDVDQAKKLLEDINPKSTMYGNKIVLEEHINQ